MQGFCSRIVIPLFAIFALMACSGGAGGGKDSNGSGGASNVSGQKTFQPDSTLNVKESSDDTDQRLENYALHINAPKEDVFKAWKDYATAANVKGLDDLDLSSEEVVRKFIMGYVLRTDMALGFVAKKTFGQNEMLYRFQSIYKKIQEITFASQDEFNATFKAKFREDVMQETFYVTAIFARLLASDLNVLFPTRFTVNVTVNFKQGQCNNTPCNEFNQRSLKLLDESANAAFFKNSVENGVTARDVMAQFFAAIFNNTTFVVADKYYAIFNYSTGEANIAQVKQEYALEAKAYPNNGLIREHGGGRNAIPLDDYSKTNTPNSTGNLLIGVDNSQNLINGNTAVGVTNPDSDRVLLNNDFGTSGFGIAIPLEEKTNQPNTGKRGGGGSDTSDPNDKD